MAAPRAGNRERPLRGAAWPLLALAAAAGCSSEGGTGPNATRYHIEVHDGNNQFGAPGSSLPDPIRVIVFDEGSERAGQGVTVQWRVTRGAATVTPSSATVDAAGLASAQVRIGQDTGTVGVEARVESIAGDPAVFTLRSLLAPSLTSVSPNPVGAGQVVTIAGRDFSTRAGETSVLFGGIRGTVTSATSTQLQVRVPSCLPSRTLPVQVQLGGVASGSLTLTVSGGIESPLGLNPGQARAFTDPAAIACVRLPGTPGARFLVVPQNAAAEPRRSLAYRLVGLGGSTTSPPFDLSAQPAFAASPQGRRSYASEWEARLRLRELQIRPSEFIRPRSGARMQESAAAPPLVGERKEFKVFNKENQFTDVTAEVKYVSTRAVFYQDVNAPAGGLSAADFQRFGRLFDDPIYPTDTAIFGEVSDIDANGLVQVLFTPVVNELTPRGEPGFIVGFFYGNDLADRQGSNKGELFYALVPDPEAKFSDRRTVSDVLNTVPPVLSHEFQHMIHYNQRVLMRQTPQEVLWLSEALAHMAEDVIGDVLASRNDPSTVTFRTSNVLRAFEFMKDPTGSGVVASISPGTLGERGSAWLFLKYLVGHYGGNDLLRRITQSTRSGSANVVAETGRPWATLFGNYAVALWADGAPELAGAAVDPLLTIPNLDLRSAFGQRGFPLQPRSQPFNDFQDEDVLPASSSGYLFLDPGSSQRPPLSAGLSGRHGANFAAGATPQFSILRVR